jgi:hypothetical protein
VVAKVADFGMSREINEDTKTPEAVDDLRFGVLRARRRGAAETSIWWWWRAHGGAGNCARDCTPESQRWAQQVDCAAGLPFAVVSAVVGRELFRGGW